MGELNSDDHYIYYCGQEFIRRHGVAIILGCNLKSDRMISVHFQGKPFNITVIQVYALTSNAKVGSQETPGVTGKFGLGVQNEAGQRLKEFCPENTLVVANTLYIIYLISGLRMIHHACLDDFTFHLHLLKF